MAIYNFGDSPWRNEGILVSLSFTCWNCNNQVASDRGYNTHNDNLKKKIYLCPHCHAPNVYDLNGKAILSVHEGTILLTPVKDLLELKGSLKTHKKPLSNEELHDFFAEGITKEVMLKSK